MENLKLDANIKELKDRLEILTEELEKLEDLEIKTEERIDALVIKIEVVEEQLYKLQEEKDDEL